MRERFNVHERFEHFVIYWKDYNGSGEFERGEITYYHPSARVTPQIVFYAYKEFLKLED